MFTFKNGTFLTRAKFATIIKQRFPSIHLNTHSFRIGGASAAFAAGVPEATIQVLGRWSSDAYRAYIRIPDSTIRDACISMSQTQSLNQHDLHLRLFDAMEECDGEQSSQ